MTPEEYCKRGTIECLSEVAGVLQKVPPLRQRSKSPYRFMGPCDWAKPAGLPTPPLLASLLPGHQKSPSRAGGWDDSKCVHAGCVEDCSVL
jgi:hypothetical protein